MERSRSGVCASDESEAAITLKAGDLAGIFSIEARDTTTVPLVMSPASCGFPSPADDYLDRPLDFNELLVAHPSATFAVRIQGESKRDAGLFPGDIAVVDRSLAPFNGCVVLALLDNEFTIKRYQAWRGSGSRTDYGAEDNDF